MSPPLLLGKSVTKGSFWGRSHALYFGIKTKSQGREEKLPAPPQAGPWGDLQSRPVPSAPSPGLRSSGSGPCPAAGEDFHVSLCLAGPGTGHRGQCPPRGRKGGVSVGRASTPASPAATSSAARGARLPSPAPSRHPASRSSESQGSPPRGPVPTELAQCLRRDSWHARTVASYTLPLLS